jgi:ATP-dependent Clp protease ATP-binding subunit ClpA
MRDSIGSEHLLLGLLREPRCDAAEALVKHKVTYQQARNEIIKMAEEKSEGE